MNLEQELGQWGPEALASRSGPPSIDESRRYCRQLATSHYENFIVVGLFTPPRLRPAFEAVYGYCRWADDLGDETGDRDRSERLLAWWSQQLDDLYRHDAPAPRHPVFVALSPVVREFEIPQRPFADLVSAFVQDQHVTRYETREGLVDYCRRSADPVGELVLRLFRAATPENLAMSASICTGLQLANFWQDVSRDLAIGRIYVPADDMARHGVTEADLRTAPASPAFRRMLADEVAWTRSLFDQGKPLTTALPGRFGLALRLFHAGGVATLDAIEGQDYDVLTRRPRIGKMMRAKLMARAFADSLRHRGG
jgi:squalene synthase HpnC